MRLYSLKAIRVNLGLTLEEASELIGVSKYTLFNYEHFKTVPSNDKIKKIMAVYGVNYNEIRFLPNKNEKKLAVKKM